MDPKGALRQEICYLEEQIRVRKRALRQLELAGGQVGPFVGKRPLEAINQVLSQNGGRMKAEDLTATLIAGGLTAGKKRAHHNIRVSLEISARVGSLIVDDGWVSLPGGKG